MFRTAQEGGNTVSDSDSVRREEQCSQEGQSAAGARERVLACGDTMGAAMPMVALSVMMASMLAVVWGVGRRCCEDDYQTPVGTIRSTLSLYGCTRYLRQQSGTRAGLLA